MNNKTQEHKLFKGAKKFDIPFLINSMWWNLKENIPHNCLILGDKSTIINLGWFELINNEWSLTNEGELNYKILLKNNKK